jgi:predicted DNA-binding transcriptional regulator YafY
MRPDDVASARDLAGRVHLVDAGQAPPGVPRLVADALSGGRVLRISYRDRAGAVTAREIEPLGYVCRASHWYLVAWCRRRDAVRAFRTDRITAVTVTAEVPAPRPLWREDLDIPPGLLRRVTLA